MHPRMATGNQTDALGFVALWLLIKLSPQNNLFPLTRPFAKKSWSIGQKKENRKTDWESLSAEETQMRAFAY